MEKALQHGSYEVGTLRIEPDVVGAIAGLAASEVPGVAGMSGVSLVEMLRKSNLSKGVRVTIGEREAIVDLYIVLEYGVKIPEVAQRVQENVRNAIETMTSLQVVEVNVHIQSVIIQEAREEALSS
ncbi:MAG: Asp23/Gls24 family envelope stress response protein [Firmicutes bacterium]|nr:Asp23/Gls24 family envelope stress response protein [Dethiobacter sp.]MBS3889301.1 Asp23/Gls24 family envelope stress response protein [Bacillota bacterium]MBS4053155.1 Asp23/Gls24 family envelope stress response protein [Thermaerobacter sp.]